MVTILLYGELGQRFGRQFDFHIHSPAEAIRALAVQLPGFRQFFLDHRDQPFKVLGEINGHAHEYSEDDLANPQSKGVLKIVPQVSGSSAAGRIILGGALIGLALLNPAGFLSAKFASGLTALGGSLALGGAAELIAKRFSPNQNQQEKPENQPSYTFDGAVNTMGQGGPVPIGYGRMMIGSQVISVGFSTNNEIAV
jgi:predicted phage tail protein